MALLSDGAGRDYAQRHMPAVKTGTGPWGEAIRYWLPRRNMRQADLARRTGIEEKTISSMARGFHTTTRKLEAVARAFDVPIDDVLVSPARYRANEDRKRLIQEAVEAALRAMETPTPPGHIVSPTTMALLEQDIASLEDAGRVGQTPTLKLSEKLAVTKRPSKKKKR